MSTRYLVMVIVDGDCKVAQYGHFDGYPTGAGINIVNYILHEQNKEIFLANLRKCEFTEEDLPANDSWKVLIDIEQEPQQLYDYRRFVYDSLFCEWVYVLDYDAECLEVYKGFNKAPLDPSERFYIENQQPDGQYYAVKLASKYNFTELTDDTMEDLYNEIYPPDESE